MTQPGETDDFSVSHHIKLLNKYLGKRKVDAVIVNNGKISPELIDKYSSSEQKDVVDIEYENIEKLGAKVIEGDLATIENGFIRHNALKVSIKILSYLLD